MSYKILKIDPYLNGYENDLVLRMDNYIKKRKELVGDGNLSDFANGYQYFGFHKVNGGFIYREWAPSADAVYLTGDMVGWDKQKLKLQHIGNGVFEIFIKGENFLFDGCKVKTIIEKNGNLLERIPLYIKRVEQDKNTYEWNGVMDFSPEYKWKKKAFKPKKNLYIYECHIGMAQEKEGVGSYKEFTKNVLPRIKDLGYNTIQIMAIMEHPYYASFGYQVTSFFAVSSRYGCVNDLKELIDTAHQMGIAVLLDVVHSHASSNVKEGISEFDGTCYQFFHEGERGNHPAWGTKLFNYGKNQVIHFLLSNLKFYLEEYKFDGFRFDGVTSMLYHDHGLGTAFTDYSKYFSINTDTESVTYLQLANELIKEVNKNAISIAEDMSAMPGACLPIEDGGLGFDYRLAMGAPDMWIKLLKDQKDEEWSMWHIWGELTSRRPKEKYIGYAESHDQALVGDKTIMFRLCDKNMYTSMSKFILDPVIDRGVALHKMIRLVTLTLAGEGYLNFMGNEFGHPEWIDFPREGNGWSHFYCRRQWSLVDDTNLRYSELNEFDKKMIEFCKNKRLLSKKAKLVDINEQNKTLSFSKGKTTFVFNFNPEQSFNDYFITVKEEGEYKVVFDTDNKEFGGFDRISNEYVYTAKKTLDGKVGFFIYLPSRTALAVERV